MKKERGNAVAAAAAVAGLHDYGQLYLKICVELQKKKKYILIQQYKQYLLEQWYSVNSSPARKQEYYSGSSMYVAEAKGIDVLLLLCIVTQFTEDVAVNTTILLLQVSQLASQLRFRSVSIYGKWNQLGKKPCHHPAWAIWFLFISFLSSFFLSSLELKMAVCFFLFRGIFSAPL